jgi:LysR family transcriptional regulator, glycine cleavage system transcriptional activator
MPVPLVRLPSLDLVKGFVAVARRQSITQAADELCITQSAMSKQVRTLEGVLGVRLLHRGFRQVTLTDEGRLLFDAADGAIAQLQEAMAQFGARRMRPVTITTSTGVAALWLLPRLGDFQQRHPEIDVRLAATMAVLDLETEGIDLALRYCSERQAPRGATLLFGDTIAPVAHPAYPVAALDTQQALARCTLIEFDTPGRPWLHWADWLAARGWTTAQAGRVLRFNQYEQAIQAAASGQGVALGRLELVGLLLQEGRLHVLPTAGPEARSEYAHWLVQAAGEPRPEVAQVGAWIRQAAGAA